MNQVQWCYVFVRETIKNKRGMISAVLNETNGSCLEKAMNAPLVWRAKGEFLRWILICLHLEHATFLNYNIAKPSEGQASLW